MSAAQRTTRTRMRRWVTRTLVPVAAVALMAAPGIASAGSGESGGDPMVAEAVDMQKKVVEYWNARKWDDYAALYEDDAIAMPPNHEPIFGAKAIAEYYKGYRDFTGELSGDGTFRSTASGELAAVVGKYSSYSKQLSFTTHEVWRRQPDGSLKMHIDMFGLRDPGM